MSLPDSLFFGDIATKFQKWIDESSYSSYFILVDSSSSVYCLSDIIHLNPNIDWKIIEIPRGEAYKTITTCSLIWEELFTNGADRFSLMVNLGGGVIGDMGGLAAGTYMRGIDFVQIPTTLLSMVDASVGGKVAVDFHLAKNIIGLFKTPVANFIDSKWLHTLPQEEIRSGWAEMIKHAMIADTSAFEKMSQFESFDEIDFESWIMHSVSIKYKIVESDPTEQHLRKGLNFGHTIGHAVETFFLEQETPKKHGECVAIGMLCAAYISNKMEGLPNSELEAITKLIKKWYPPIAIPPEAYSDILDRMSKDKKSRAGQVKFTLLPQIGTYVYDKTPSNELIKESMAFYNQVITEK